jgi:hypothetical protein
MKFGLAQLCFSENLISEGAIQRSAIVGRFHGEVSREEWHGSQDLGTSNGGSSPYGDEELTC